MELERIKNILNLKSVRERVSWILENVPASRSDNTLLLVLYWRLFDNVNIAPDICTTLIDATHPETILRTRRKLLEEHKNNTTIREEFYRWLRGNR